MLQSNIINAEKFQANSAAQVREALMNVGIGVTTNPAPMPTNQQAIGPEKTNAERRAEFLETVRNFVCKDRNVTHGDAEDNFRVIGQLWDVYLTNTPLTTDAVSINNVDVAIMMCLFKVARLMANPKNMENWHDLAGYAACGGGIVMKKLEEGEMKEMKR
jgi:hypothetical protein